MTDTRENEPRYVVVTEDNRQWRHAVRDTVTGRTMHSGLRNHPRARILAAALNGTHPDVFTLGVEQGWADVELDPADIDWAERQARALVPYEVVDGRPRKPGPSTGIRRGRNELGRWGEQAAADAIVAIRRDGVRFLLLIERGDGYGWALPGGGVDQGEDPVHAAFRECKEESGLDLGDVLASGSWRALQARVVDDPRASDEAWMATLPVLIDLGTLPPGTPFPAVAGADDAKRATWVRADSYTALRAELAYRYGGEVFAAHVKMLREVLDGDADL